MRQPPGRRLAVTLCLILSAVLVPALPAQAAPTFAGLLAGPSVAATYPSGVEYDDVNGRLVVADTGLDRIEFYSYTVGSTPATSTYQRLGMFGSHGTADGQFDTPRDVAIDDRCGRHGGRRRFGRLLRVRVGAPGRPHQSDGGRSSFRILRGTLLRSG